MKEGVSPGVEAACLVSRLHPTKFGSLGAREGCGVTSPCDDGGRMRDAGIRKELGQVAKICRWDEPVMELEGLKNHRRLEGLEDVMRVKSRFRGTGSGWARKGGGKDLER